MMSRSIISAGACMAVAASEESIFDAGLSLLQTRVHKHEVAQEVWMGDDKYTVQAGGTLCSDDEVITFAKCVELQQRNLVMPNLMGAGYVVANQRGQGVQPPGCFKAGNGIYFNDEPAGGTNAGCLPICSPNGGRAAEIVAQGISCQEPTCKLPAGHHKLIWDDSVVMPELRLVEGGVCDEACELLSYEQCTKAGDMGLIDELSGLKVLHEPIHSAFGPSRTFGTTPSACSVNLGRQWGKAGMFWNSMDTPTGIRAKPLGNGEPWVSDSGVGTGWGHVAAVCGVCTTTTTPAPIDAEVPEEDEGAAVGDPHMSRTSGDKLDLEDGMLNHHH